MSMASLRPYEIEQVRRIAGWKAEPPMDADRANDLVRIYPRVSASFAALFPFYSLRMTPKMSGDR
jgi:hypothetical protein